LEERVVLHGVTASFKAGTLNALMGPSGSGKTSLLSVVAGFVDPGHVTGRMLVNGRVRALPRRLVGFVFQEDLMLSQLTVLETIQVAAALKLPMSVSRELREEAVSSLLAQLGLEHVASTLVGDAKTRGVSGGQKKRLAVAVELVTRPSVLLMDEPTSGLDATTALSLCTMLQGLASSGYNIVCSIHQPRTNIFDLFDHLLLLSLGRMVYSGPPEGCVGFLETVTGRSIPARTNAADWLMDVVSEDEALGEGQRLLPDAYIKHEQGNGMTSASSCGSLSEMNEGEEKTGGTDCFGRGRGAHDVSRDETVVRKFATTWLRQLTVLLQRENKQRRGLALTRMTLLQVVLSSILTGLFWFQLPATDATVHERSSLLFFIIIAQSNQAVLTSINSFSVERVIMQRERAKAMYRMSPYFLVSDYTSGSPLTIAYRRH
jgi:ABC-type multidrug transport system ATPase subunit